MLKRRAILQSSTLLLAAMATSGGVITLAKSALAAGSDKLTRTDAEWQDLLTADQYQVLRHEATERAFTSKLLEEHREGTFSCAGCDLPLFSSKTKFDSGTGWPSFWQPLTNAVIEKEDSSYGMARTAVECRRCDGHLGHVFNDGPAPTGLRYCINGIALKFTAAAT